MMPPTSDVALTFDVEHPDGPQCPPGIAERIVSLLDAEGVRASFFLQGRWATAYPDLARHIADHEHLVGNHSHSHANLTNLSPAGLASEVRAAEHAIEQCAGVNPRPWFRCPHGTHSHSSGLAPLLRSLGYQDAHWNVTALDWEAGATAAEIAARVIDGVGRHRSGAVVLLHSWPAVVPEALRRILDGLRGRDRRFVTVADLPRDPSWLRSGADRPDP